MTTPGMEGDTYNLPKKQRQGDCPSLGSAWSSEIMTQKQSKTTEQQQRKRKK